MSRRTWVKIYNEKWLRGTLREETPATRGIWVDVLTMAGDSYYSDLGEIKIGDGIGYTDDQISNLLKINIKEWQEAKLRLVKTDRISVDKSNVIKVKNWYKYQTEYIRQKPYRLKYKEKSQKLHKKVTRHGYSHGYRVDIDIDIDKDKDKDKNKDIKKEVILSPKEKVSDTTRLFRFWNGLARKDRLSGQKTLIESRTPSAKLSSVLTTRLNDYDYKTVRRAVWNYRQLLRHPNTKWTYRWGLLDFLTREKDNIARFKDWDIIRYNWIEAGNEPSPPKNKVIITKTGVSEWDYKMPK